MEIEVKEYESLKAFFNSIVTDIVDRSKNQVYRGMADAQWDLESSLHRFKKELEQQHQELNVKTSHEKHASLLEQDLFETFKKNITVNQDVSPELIENMTAEDILQLGQHFGLPSPLLDWTRSPYVSLYFAIKDRLTQKPKKRALWLLNLDILRFINHQIETDLWKRNDSYKRFYPKYQPIESRPLRINQRIEFQQGLFTRERDAEPITKWAERISSKIIVPKNSLFTKCVWPENERERLEVLHILNLMNINDRVLFPDIEGSVKDAKAAASHSLLDRGGFSLSFSLLPAK